MRNETSESIIPVILCGGSGTRLWPLSRELYPKPFIKMPNGESLFRNTVDRAKNIANSGAPLIVTNEEHRFYVLESLKEAGIESEIILEPAARNTAPAICLAALQLVENGQGESLMLVAPSDHFFDDDQAFCEIVNKAAPLAARGYIVTFGIKPTRPDTGYGYIKAETIFDDFCKKVDQFVEKPAREKAEKMLASGCHYWNSGIFLLSPATYLAELEKYSSDMLAACRNAWEKKTCDDQFIRPDAELFLTAEENSIDYAIMEKTDLAMMAPLHCNWNDMGSWDAFFNTATPENNGNVTRGDVFLEDVENSYINARKRLIAAIGLKDMIVVESGDAVLIMPKNRSQDVKKVVKFLKNNKRDEYRLHPLVYRPWGSYERLVLGDGFQVKRIVVNPGCSLSLQMHHHRSEHWIVVRGTAEVTVDDQTSLYTENHSVYIPIGSKHKLRNPGIIPLELIEVQSGRYLGEDDIVRYADDYGRV